MKTIAFVGIGNIFETTHFPNCGALSEDCKVVALVHPNLEKAQQMAERLGVPHAFGSLAQLFETMTVDTVFVCTPNRFHFEQVCAALEHGCDVFCEKPPAMTADEAFQMAALAAKHGRFLGYNLPWRQAAEVAALKPLVENGTLGNVYHAKCSALRRRGVPGWGSFTSKAIQGGGPLIDLGVHMLDTAMYLMGYPKPLAAFAVSYAEIATHKQTGLLGSWNPAAYEVEDSLFALITLENNKSLLLETSFALNMRPKDMFDVSLFGSEQGAALFPLCLFGDENGNLTDRTFPFLPEVNRQKESVRQFLRACGGLQANTATAYEGYVLQAMLGAAYAAAERRGEVRMNLREKAELTE